MRRIDLSSALRALLFPSNNLSANNVVRNVVGFAGGVVDDVAQSGRMLKQLIAGRLRGTVQPSESNKVTPTETAPNEMTFKYDKVKARWESFIFKGEGAKQIEPVRREDIKGINPIIDELDRYIHYLRHYREMNDLDPVPEPPTALLFKGKTGTGKTYATQYIATTAEVRCVNVGDFLHFGKKGPNKLDVRALFEVAASYVEQRKEGLVVFWDEFDQFTNDNATERQEAIKELKEQLSGLQVKPRGVVFIFATNKDQKIPEDLKREGRIGMHFQFLPPDRDGLVDILKMYVEKYPYSTGIDYSTLTHLIPAETVAPAVSEYAKKAYFEAALHAARENREVKITQEVLTKVLLRHRIGLSAGRNRTKEELFETAVHEMGHAVVGRKLGLEIPAVTIQDTASSLGQACMGIYSISRESALPYEVKLARLAFYFGGQAAQELCEIKLDVGVKADLEGAGWRSVELIERFGLDQDLDGFPLKGLHSGRQTIQGANHQNLSEKTLAESDEAIRKLFKEQREKARTILKEFGRKRLEWLANQLVERVTILQSDLDQLIAEAEEKFKLEQSE